MSRYRPKGTTTRALEDGQVLHYRKAYAAKEMTRREIMIDAGVSMGTVDRMLNGETYQHLGTMVKETNTIGGMSKEELEESARRMMEFQENLGKKEAAPLPEGLSPEGLARFKAITRTARADEMLAELGGVPPNPLDEA